MGERLSEAKFGILCLTQENLTEPWILFEAGAIAKAIQDAHVCPYLLGFEPSQIPAGPLSQFQAKRATKEDTLDLIRAINVMLSPPLGDDALGRAFDRCWPSLEETIQKAQALSTKKTVSKARSVEDMVQEMLPLVRAISTQLSERIVEEQALLERRMMEAQARLDSQRFARSSEPASSAEFRKRIMNAYISEEVEGLLDHDLELVSIDTKPGLVGGVVAKRGTKEWFTAQVARDNWEHLEKSKLLQDIVLPLVERLNRRASNPGGGGAPPSEE